MAQKYTYSDPTLSLWQAAVAEVYRRRASVQNRMALATSQRITLPAMDPENLLMSPARLLGSALSAKSTSDPSVLFALSAIAPAGTETFIPLDCAKMAGEFLWAEIKGDHQKSALLAGELKKSTCDVGWAECVTTYLAYKASESSLLYRPSLDPVVDLDTKSRLAIVGDWGTGDEVAINLLEQVASLKPDVLIHLGDVYYAGTHNEEQSNFLDICRTVLGNSVALFSLCGNHDMYSGGNGYYWLLDQIGQKASYFCLRNAAWQFLAMDTGHNDNSPLTVATNMTSLVKDQGWSEADWHLAKIQQAGSRKTVLLSHHQLFSPFGAVGTVNGQSYAYNPNLLGTFQTVLPMIQWWFWGHEHTLAIFDSYMNIQRGRCLGASAVPVFTDQQKYANANGLVTYQGAPLPTWNAGAMLGNNGTDYNHAFAVMNLNGPAASVDYYQVPILGAAIQMPVADSI